MSIHNIEEIKKVYEKLDIKTETIYSDNLSFENCQYPSAYNNLPTETAYNTNK